MASKTKMLILTGDAKLNRQLARLSSNEAKKVIREAARPVMKRVLPRVKMATPYKTGLLMRSIKITAIKRSRKRFGVRMGTGKRDQRSFGGTTFYGAFVEFGRRKGGKFTKPTEEGSKKKLEGGTKNAGAHMIEKTTEKHKPRMIVFYRYLLKMALEKLARQIRV